jgi:hypothetical protein
VFQGKEKGGKTWWIWHHICRLNSFLATFGLAGLQLNPLF